MPKSTEKQHGPPAEKSVGKAVEKLPSNGPAEERENMKNGAKDRRAPENVTGHTHVNVAFPFSKISVQEPSGELIELVTLLSDLVGALADWVPEETLAEIRTRAEALAARLST